MEKSMSETILLINTLSFFLQNVNILAFFKMWCLLFLSFMINDNDVWMCNDLDFGLYVCNFLNNCANNNISLNQSIIKMMINVSSIPTISIIYHIYYINFYLWTLVDHKDDGHSERQRDMCHSLFESRSPARSAIQLPAPRPQQTLEITPHWGVTCADRSFVRNTPTKAMSISSLNQDDCTHLVFCLIWDSERYEMPTEAVKG